MKMYMSRFNKEQLIADDQDKKITLIVLLGGIWPHHPFMLELSRKTPPTIRDFMDLADEYVNVEDILRALVGSR